MPEEYVRVVTVDEAAFTEIIVDNEDEGFSMPVNRVQRYMRPGLQGGNWGVAESRYEFGRYETNYRQKSGGDGAQPAIWATNLPYAGEYDVAYYFLPRRINGRTSRDSFRGAADYYLMTIRHDGGEWLGVIEILDPASEILLKYLSVGPVHQGRAGAGQAKPAAEVRGPRSPSPAPLQDLDVAVPTD